MILHTESNPQSKSSEDCDHVWEEGYYGHECMFCGQFYSYGNAPWDVSDDLNTLCDNDPMPFGKHKGRLMQDVPANYLHYLWSNGMKSEETPVAEYIRSNLDALKIEFMDGIWD